MTKVLEPRVDLWNPADYAKNSSAQESWARELVSKLALQGHESVLDIGCGDGRITHEIARRLHTGMVVGIDSSESMIALSDKSFAGHNVSFYLMNAVEIHLEHTFDIAFSNAALHWVKDHPAVLAGLKKHLNPGAKILFQMGGKGNGQAIFNTLAQMITASPWNGYFKDFDFPYHFYAVEDYQHWLPAAGFTPTRIELIPKDMVHPNPQGLTGWLRTTWFPFTNRLPVDLRETFLTELVNRYIESNPLDPNGQTHVKMVRLEVEARVS